MKKGLAPANPFAFFGLPIITPVIGPLLCVTACFHRPVTADIGRGTGKLFLITTNKTLGSWFER